jgi:hypothetical protein
LHPFFLGLLTGFGEVMLHEDSANQSDCKLKEQGFGQA